MAAFQNPCEVSWSINSSCIPTSSLTVFSPHTVIWYSPLKISTLNVSLLLPLIVGGYFSHNRLWTKLNVTFCCYFNLLCFFCLGPVYDDSLFLYFEHLLRGMGRVVPSIIM